LEHKAGSLSIDRILKDMVKVFESMEMIIWQAKGPLMIPGIGDRKCRRALQQHASGINRCDGKRDHQPEKGRVHWIHPHAWAAYDLKLETSTAVHAGKKKNQQYPYSGAHVGEGEGENCL
jgi:hypothetical protein